MLYLNLGRKVFRGGTPYNPERLESMLKEKFGHDVSLLRFAEQYEGPK